MRSSVGRLAAIAVLVALLTAGLSAPTTGQSEAAATVMHVVLEPDGDSRWTVSARFSLADANETAAFDRLATEYVTGQTDVLTADPYRSAAAQASEATGRPMAINNVTRAAGQDNATGELRLSFTWTNFSRVTNGGNRLVLGDVFSTPSGTWLPELRRNQLLVIEFPEGFVVDSVSRGLDNRSIRVLGPASFVPGQPSATLERSGTVGTSPGPNTTPGPGIGVPSALSAGAAFAILLVAGYLIYRRQQDETAPEPGATEPAPAIGGPTDVELLSDEEQVLRLLRSEGGRMKQVDIVEETDWSNAKVSQLLSSMAEAGQVEKLRIGRENLISLADDED